MAGHRTLRNGVLAVLAAGLVVRLVDLGTRTAHWDEGRVGWWVLHTIETGQWQYRPIIHGPFVQHVARPFVSTFGASDFALRLPVALVSLLLPAGALLYRRRLSDAETAALAGFLALDPLVLYYSRFFRSDVPLAAFAFCTVGALVVLVDTGKRRWLVAAAAGFALALTTKENALLYALSWLGAGAVTGAWWCWRQYRRDNWHGGWRDVWRHGRPGAWRRARDWPDGRTVGRWALTSLGALALVVVVVVVFYAPRTPGTDAVGLWTALGRPAQWPALVGEATLGSWRRLTDLWVRHRSHAYGDYLAHYLFVLLTGSGAVAVAAVAGVVAGRDRPLVVFCAVWGLSAVVGYPYAADIKAPWLVVHATVPLAVPAAVGAVAVVREARSALGTTDRLHAAIFVWLVVCGAGQMAIMGAGANYRHPTEEQLVLVQGAQPGSQWGPTLDRVERAAARNPADEPDVAVYGWLAAPNGSSADRRGKGWFRRLPLPWYTAARDLQVTAVHDVDGLEDPPPVVVAKAPVDPAVDARLSGYERTERAALRHGHDTTYRILGTTKRISGRSFVFYVRTSQATARAETARAEPPPRPQPDRCEPSAGAPA